MAAILEVDQLEKKYGDFRAVKGISFSVEEGEVFGLLGPNGAGKSTLCSVIAGLYRPDSGEMLMDGEPMVLKSPKHALAAGIGMVYQHFRLVSNLTVAENLAFPLGVRKKSKTEIEERVR